MQSLYVSSCRFLLLGFLFLSITACQADSMVEEIEPDPVQIGGYPDVDGRLWTFFEAFEKEGLERGLIIDLRSFNIIADIDDIPEENVAGRCSYGHLQDRHITIDRDFFNSTTQAYREMIVFHELGHCYLNQGHREGQFDNGVCRSIMRSGNGGCFDYYRSDTREYYLDELFTAD